MPSNGGIRAQMRYGDVYPGAKARTVVLVQYEGAEASNSPLRGKGVGEMPARAAQSLAERGEEFGAGMGLLGVLSWLGVE